MSKIADTEANATSLDGLVNDNGLITTLRNGPKPSWQYIVDQVYAQLGYAVAGSFVTGFTYTGIRQVGVDASGNTWIYTGGQQNIPHAVAAGTVPSEPEYFQVSVNSADNVVLDNGENLQQAIDRLNVEIDELSAGEVSSNNGGTVQDFIDSSRVEAVLDEITSGSGVVGTMYTITDMADASADIVSGSDSGGHYIATLSNGNKLKLVVNNSYVYIEWFGVKEGVDSYARLTEATNYARDNNLELLSLSGKIYTISYSVSFRGIRYVDIKSQINGSGDFVTIYLGGSSLDLQQFYVQKVYKVNRGGSSPAIRIIGSNKNVIRIGEASIIEVYADTDSSKSGADEYCAYSDIYIQSCTTLRWNSNPASDGSVIQWINKNNFYLSFCQNFESIDNGYNHNGNHIYGGNFEASTSTINFQSGMGNTFHDVRGENSLAIIFGSSTSNNAVLTDWYDSPNNPVAGASVVDNGINNVVKNISDIYNDRVTMVSFNGTSLTDNGDGLSNIMGVNAALIKDATNNLITASANALIYVSPLIEITPSREYFDIEVVPKLSGGIRMKIEGYDSGMAIIANTGSDVFYSGATNEVAGFGENSTTITNRADQRRIRITNSSAKYIRITVNASSSGVSFRRLTLEAVTGYKFGKKILMASAMMPNISVIPEVVEAP